MNKSMQKIQKIALLAVLVTAGFLIMPGKVAAAPIQCRAIGPYNICIPNTGIIDTQVITNMPADQVVAYGGVLSSGVFMIINGRILKKAALKKAVVQA